MGRSKQTAKLSCQSQPLEFVDCYSTILCSIMSRPSSLCFDIVSALEALICAREAQKEALVLQETERAKTQGERMAEIDSINLKYDAMCQDIADKHKQINEILTQDVTIATQAYEEIRVRSQVKLEQISACKLVGCGVDDVIMVAASTGVQPDVELMKKLNVDYEHARQFIDESDVQESTGIEECGDLYRMLQAVRSVINGSGVPAMFDLQGRAGLADKWGVDRVCEWFGIG